MYLGADFLPSQVLGLECHNIDFGVGVTHVANNGAVLQLIHVLAGHNRLVPSGGDDDVNLLHNVRQFHNLVAKKITFECKFLKD